MNLSSRAVQGWLFVAAQAALLVALVFIPGSDAWPVAGLWRAVCTMLVLGGCLLAVAASLGLGRSLTPTPVPASYGELTTSGLYRWVRHPIYSGVLAAVVGLAGRSGSWLHVGIAAATFVFFDRKARWEEARLAEKYPGYEAYARRTPRFVPQLSRR